MKLKYILFLILNISFIQFSLCQDLDTNQTSNKILNANASLNDKVYFGGNLSFNIYNGIILAEISPFIGYKLKPKFSTGLGFKYMYIGSISDDISYSYYGPNVFSRYSFRENFFIHSEYEILNVYELRPLPFPNGERTLANIFQLGAAYSSSIGEKATVQILLLYDFINDVNSPYRPYYIFGSSGPPITYRVGFSYNF
jgi:hypothetical protein